MNAENHDQPLSPPPSEQEVLAAGSTMVRKRIDATAVRDRLARAAAMLAGLVAVPFKPALVHASGDGAGSIAVPLGECLVVGREVDGEARFPDCIEMSRRHFRVTRRGGHWLLEDLNSRNGTFVNGGESPVAHRMLRDGDIINAGGIDFLFVDPVG